MMGQRGNVMVVGSVELGACVKRYREAAGLTQLDLARATSLKASYITAVERGRFQLIYPEKLNSLRRALRFPGWEMLEEMGYKTDAGEEGITPGLLAQIRTLDSEQQLALIGMLRAWFK